MKRLLLLALIISCVFITDTAAANRFHNYTEQYHQPSQPVKIESATLFGGAGTEWLCGGGFLPDGSVVVAGSSLGPKLTKSGSEKVLGKDTPAPEPIEAKTDSKGKTIYPNWRADAATGFVAWLAPDLKRSTRLVRFPWKSAAITDLEVDAQGDVYITGKVGSKFAALVDAKDVSAEPAQDDNPNAFLIKLDGRSGDIVWAYQFSDSYKGPKLRVGPKGRIHAIVGLVYIFETDGRLATVVQTQRTNSWRREYNPADRSWVVGYDRNTHTGREPWRQPTLGIVNPDGEIRFDLYKWDSKLVGTDKYRLVSDSSFRKNAMHYAADGTLYAVGWSDGGNTVLERMPRDIDTPVGKKGLGFSSWGAGVLSLAHIIHLDPKSGRVLNKTLWCGFLSGSDRPNGLSVNNLSIGPEGSVIMTGSSAFGLIQTGDNLLGEDQPGGPYVSILSKDLDTIRFSSTMLACGHVTLRDTAGQPERWDISTATVGGKPKAILVCGAIAEQGAYTEPKPTPTRDAMQTKFGGGLTDGYIMLIDLSK